MTVSLVSNSKSMALISKSPRLSSKSQASVSRYLVSSSKPPASNSDFCIKSKISWGRMNLTDLIYSVLCVSSQECGVKSNDFEAPISNSQFSNISSLTSRYPGFEFLSFGVPGCPSHNLSSCHSFFLISSLSVPSILYLLSSILSPFHSFSPLYLRLVLRHSLSSCFGQREMKLHSAKSPVN